MKNNLVIIKKAEVTKPLATQQKDGKILYAYPEISYSLLKKTMENSFIIFWIIQKLAQLASSWFKSISENENLSEQEKMVKKFLDSIDLEFTFLNLFGYGNCYRELQVAENRKDFELYPFMTHEMQIRLTNEQWVRGLKYEQMDSTPVLFEPQNVLHFKRLSITNRRHWDSLFSCCVNQIALLANIDKFYDMMFSKGMMKSKVFIDAEGKLDEDEIKVLTALIQDQMKGLDNSFATAIIPADLKTLDLQDDIEADSLLNLRDKLIKSIAIGMNIPYDVVMTDNSNRSTAEVSKELVEAIVAPVQKRFVAQLQKYLKLYWFDPKIVDKIALIEIDTGKALELMKVITGYVNAGIYEPNEWRAILKMDPHPDGTGLKATKQVDPTLQTDVVKIVEERYDENTLSKIQKTCVTNA